MQKKAQKHSYCNNLMFIKTLGSGYNAKVKLAYDKQAAKHVAVKIIKKIDRSNLKTLQNELNIMMKLKHQNIIQVLDVQQNQNYYNKNGEVKRVTYIVLELAEGGELFDYVANTGHFSYEVARTYFHQLIEGLEYAHSNKIAHRDLKPENILFDLDFQLKVADWGFATSFKEGKKNQTVLGTESYMAPQINLKQSYNSNEVDLFAAGIVLFIMIVGTPPFVKADQSDPYYNLIMNNKLNKFWNQHLKFKNDKKFFTEEFKDLLNRMLQFDPKNRLSISQIKQHPWYQGTVIDQKILTAEFKKKKKIVDQQIEMERKRKQIQKIKNNHNNHNVAGFRSVGVDSKSGQGLMLGDLEGKFDFEKEREVQQNDIDLLRNIAVYSGFDAKVLLKILVLGLIEVGVVLDDIVLNQNKFKVDFGIWDDSERIEMEARIQKYDDEVNQIVFMRKSGNMIIYFNYIKGLVETLNQIKDKLSNNQIQP